MKKLGKSKVSARWVPKQLTEDQNASRMTIGKEHLGHFNHKENKFLNSIVTGDEVGFIMQTVTARYYSEVILKKLKEKLKKLRPRLAQKNVLLLHDTAPSDTASVQ